MEMNKELLAKAKEMKTPEELMALAKESGIEMTKEKADEYFKQLSTSSGEIADEQVRSPMTSLTTFPAAVAADMLPADPILNSALVNPFFIFAAGWEETG